MRMKYIIILCVFAFGLQAQSIKPRDLVQQHAGKTVKSVELFNENSRSVKTFPSTISKYKIVDLNRGVVNNLLANQSPIISFTIPQDERRGLTLKLVEVEIPNYELVALPSGQSQEKGKAKHYRGIVEGDENSLAAISVFEDEVMGFYSTSRDQSNYVIGKMTDGTGDHIIYEDSKMADVLSYVCGTEDSAEPYTKEDLQDHADDTRALSDCVGMYFEVDYDIFQNKGGVNQAGNYIAGIYNQVATLYANENINTNVSQISVWNQASPYNASSTSGMLTQFGSARPTFPGNLAMLVSYKLSGGIAWVNGLCRQNQINSRGFSSISSSYSNVPTYSWTVSVLAHEFGHLFGSQHTHACVWNGNNTAIDNCANTEGGCGSLGLPPRGGGTIMSYCHLLSSVGISFGNGFGTQPGNVMRARVSAGSCLNDCSTPPPPPAASCSDGIKNQGETGIDCGGPNCPACPSCNDGIRNNGETGIDCGGPNCAACGTCNDGIRNNGETSIDCGGPNCAACPTCNDGIRNNGETSIDCGGPNCAACPTCNDGIRNNGETSIDCGGPNCPSCPTCFDGIQNQGETGVDCGGPNCSACSSCNDGIRNNGETSIDCGGPNCGPCPTCNDGIQNQAETGVDCGGPNCSACASCNDGVRNNGETGVDCGGPNCSPCASCNDGIRNNGETGVDCGGPNCSACPSCNDGVQNNGETGVDCGGPNCGPCQPDVCTLNEVAINITFDKYPGETTWKIFNSAGQDIARGGPYTTPEATITELVCLSDGCFSFVIYDLYKDGICCGYGNGKYEIKLGSRLIASGSQFKASETKQVCVGGSSEPASCSDGKQNQGETGIDCGGPNCPACETCTDGKQNNGETGIDCGGPNCSACPSCNDGIQNNGETGVDCGGPICTPCNSCSDGVQNFGETGVDCGGPNCIACATCSDGIRNQDETGIDCGGANCIPCSTVGCVENSVKMTIQVDNYPKETTWILKNEAGETIKSGGPYSTQRAVYVENLCLPTGCYEFTINDSYGDGICCGYGPGNYLIMNGLDTMAVGSQFKKSDVKTFCVGAQVEEPVEPTCEDGIQNQDETGVDCGGEECEPCSKDEDPAQVLLFGSYFETGLDGWTDGGIDCDWYQGSNSPEGQGSVRIRDDSGPSSSAVSPKFDLTPYNQLEVKLLFLPYSMEDGEDFFVELFDGTTWVRIAQVIAGQDFQNYTVHDLSVSVSRSQVNFSSEAMLRIMCDASSDADIIYFDAVQVFGSTASGILEDLTIQKRVTPTLNTVEPNENKLYPNPASETLNLTVDINLLENAEYVTIEIFDVLGRKVWQNKSNEWLEKDRSIDISNLETGAFIIRVLTEDDVIYTERFSKFRP